MKDGDKIIARLKDGTIQELIYRVTHYVNRDGIVVHSYEVASTEVA